MTRVLAVLAFVSAVLACGAPPLELAETTSAIYHGERVVLGELPGVGALSRFDGVFGRGFCSSALVAPDVVLTAAHCVPAPEDRLDVYFIRDLFAPFADDFENPLWTKVRAWRVHPDYRPASSGRLKDDLAVVFLDRALTAVEPYALADETVAPSLVVGAPVLIVGYGRDETGFTGALSKAKTTISFVGASELRVGGAEPSSSRCQGDSGGPTFMELEDGRQPARRIVSVNSYGLDGCGSATTEARVDAHLAWIVDTLREACESGARIAEGCASSVRPRFASAPAEGDAGVEPPAPALDTPPDAGQVDLAYEPWSSGCVCVHQRRASGTTIFVLVAMVVVMGASQRRRAHVPR